MNTPSREHFKKIFAKKKIVLTFDNIPYKLRISFNRVAFFYRCVFGKRVANFIKPEKTRRRTMENFVKGVVGIFAIFLAKIQMLNLVICAKQGGGGYMEWKVENG
jgi:hypothetical protein